MRPDDDDVFSHGYVCPKGIAIADVHHDPDRLRQPLRRTADGGFEPIALGRGVRPRRASGLRRDARRARRATRSRVYLGNPIVHNHGALLMRSGLLKALGTRNRYSAGSQDTSPRFAASYYLYGSSLAIPMPDVDRTDYFLCIGANPVVSNGSVLTAPDMRGAPARASASAAARLVVVDPRRTETAREADEHVADPPRRRRRAAARDGAGAGRARPRRRAPRSRAHASGWDEVERRLRAVHARARRARFTGVAGRRPSCASRSSSPTRRPSVALLAHRRLQQRASARSATWATDLLNLVAGRLGADGGAMFPTPAIDVAARSRA